MTSEDEFIQECAELLGKTVEELDADDEKFWATGE